MKKKPILFSILSVCFLCVIGCQRTDAAAIKWVYSYDMALEQAQKEQKPIMLDFYTDWCGWCKKLDGETYQDSRVIQLSGSFVCLKLDAEKYKNIAGKYNVRGYPTVLFTDQQGKVIGGGPGFREAAQLSSEMNAALLKFRGY